MSHFFELEPIRSFATAFPHKWNAGCNEDGSTADWGDDGYVVDRAAAANGSSYINTWRLNMLEELDTIT